MTTRRALVFLIALSAPISAEQRCPWLNAATAAGVLGGSVESSVTATSCEFVRHSGQQESVLRIEVTPVATSHEQCTSDAEPLKGIGNQAAACTYRGKSGWAGEQVTGMVRAQAFVVRIETNDRTIASKTLREKARSVAEQIAGILF